ncbi:Imm49 family immunity protein [Corallincola spongiicola]|nr:Imm49 family immunity protein [Corallincola spongiicola]
MKLTSNLINLELVERDLLRSQRVMDKWLADPELNTSEKGQHRVTVAANKLGYISYLKESPIIEIKKYFSLAGSAGLAKHNLRELDLPIGQTRSAWGFYENLNVLICFATDEELRLASEVNSLKYDYPGNEEKPWLLVRYIAVLKNYLADKPVLDTELAALLEECELPSRTKEEQVYVVPMIRGLVALFHDNETQWQEAISECVERHIDEVKNGDLKQSYDGYFSMPALALAKLGLSKGWKPSVESVYLPVSLIS